MVTSAESSSIDIDIHQRCLGCMELKNEARICPRCGWSERAAATSPLYLRPGTVLSRRYVTGRLLRHNSFAITYLGWDLNLNSKCLIAEYLPRELAARGADRLQVVVCPGVSPTQFRDGLEQFLETGRVLTRFRGHNVLVATSDIAIANDTAYWMMEHIDGATLQDYLAQQIRLLPAQVMRVVVPLLDALRELHQAGLLHLYLNPNMVYLTKNLDVKLALEPGFIRASRLHEYGGAVDNPGYAPAELYRPNPQAGPWSDVYAAAAVLYNALTGNPPPPAPERLHQDRLEPPRRLGITVPHVVEAALGKALAIRPEDRFPTIAAFQQALLQTQRRTYSILVRSKLPWVIPMTLALAVAGATIMVLLDTPEVHVHSVPQVMPPTLQMIPAEPQSQEATAPSGRADQHPSEAERLSAQRERLLELQKLYIPQKQQLEVTIFADNAGLATKVADNLRSLGYRHAYSNPGQPTGGSNIKYGSAPTEVIEEINLILDVYFSIPGDTIQSQRVFPPDDNDVFINLSGKGGHRIAD